MILGLDNFLSLNLSILPTCQHSSSTLYTLSLPSQTGCSLLSKKMARLWTFCYLELQSFSSWHDIMTSQLLTCRVCTMAIFTTNLLSMLQYAFLYLRRLLLYFCHNLSLLKYNQLLTWQLDGTSCYNTFFLIFVLISACLESFPAHLSQLFLSPKAIALEWNEDHEFEIITQKLKGNLFSYQFITDAGWIIIEKEKWKTIVILFLKMNISSCGICHGLTVPASTDGE